jgi:hypothetical protein
MAIEQSRIYTLHASHMPWGDYGDILLSGMTSHLERHEGFLQLERTGPFVPPIFLPGIADIVVTDDFKHLLEGSGLTGFTFQPVIKKHIVVLEWEKWDKESEEPLEYPSTGEPEDYILERAHSPELAQQIGDLWELCLEECAEVAREQIGPQTWDVEIFVVQSSWNERDWFRAKGVGYNYVSENAKLWLERIASEWVRFEPVRVR